MRMEWDWINKPEEAKRVLRDFLLQNDMPKVIVSILTPAFNDGDPCHPYVLYCCALTAAPGYIGNDEAEYYWDGTNLKEAEPGEYTTVMDDMHSDLKKTFMVLLDIVRTYENHRVVITVTDSSLDFEVVGENDPY